MTWQGRHIDRRDLAILLSVNNNERLRRRRRRFVNNHGRHLLMTCPASQYDIERQRHKKLGCAIKGLWIATIDVDYHYSCRLRLR